MVSLSRICQLYLAHYFAKRAKISSGLTSQFVSVPNFLDALEKISNERASVSMRYSYQTRKSVFAAFQMQKFKQRSSQEYLCH